MCVIYLLSYHSELKKDHDRLVLLQDGKKAASLPFFDVTTVIAGRTSHLSTPVLFALMERDIPVFFVNGRGKLIGACGAEQSRLDRLFAQQAAFQDEARRCFFMQEIVKRKIARQRAFIQIYAKSIRSQRLAEVAKQLKQTLDSVEGTGKEDALRGLEGTAARLYFSAFPEILHEKFSWPGRQQHPAYEPVNALLNYGYAFLEREVRLALMGSGLDARIGCFHVDSGRRDSLVFDLMEPYRAMVIDRLVLKLLNYGTLTPAHFEETPEGCLITEEGRRIWCQAFEAFLEKPTKLCGGVSPRELLRKEIAEFAGEVFRPAALRSA